MKEKGCDCIVTVGGVHSNHARTIAVAARELGVEPHLILFYKPKLQIVRNNYVFKSDIFLFVNYLDASYGWFWGKYDVKQANGRYSSSPTLSRAR